MGNFKELSCTYALPKLVPNVIQVLVGKKGLLAPVAHPLLVGLFIVQSKDGRDILPFAVVRGDIGAALFLGVRDHVANHAKSLSLRLGLDRAGGLGFSVSNAIEPVANTVFQH